MKRRITLLGNFDGVHLGHRELILSGCAEREKRDAVLTAWTFDTLFDPAITDLNSRVELLRSYGVDEVITESFERVKDLSCRDFVTEILKERLNSTLCICGYNYSFGRGGVGTPALLRELCSEQGIDVIVIDRVSLGKREISSTVIRELLRASDVKEASHLMGRSYFLRGTVTEGRGKGRTAGMPTVNFYPIGMCLPKNGVYATVSTLEDGRSFPSVTNIGLRPTMEDGRGISVETHVLDFEGDLYGKSVKVEFIGYIREEIKFPSITALSEQVREDIVKARKIIKESF